MQKRVLVDGYLTATKGLEMNYHFHSHTAEFDFRFDDDIAAQDENRGADICGDTLHTPQLSGKKLVTYEVKRKAAHAVGHEPNLCVFFRGLALLKSRAATSKHGTKVFTTAKDSIMKLDRPEKEKTRELPHSNVKNTTRFHKTWGVRRVNDEMGN